MDLNLTLSLVRFRFGSSHLICDVITSENPIKVKDLWRSKFWPATFWPNFGHKSNSDAMHGLMSNSKKDCRENVEPVVKIFDSLPTLGTAESVNWRRKYLSSKATLSNGNDFGFSRPHDNYFPWWPLATVALLWQWRGWNTEASCRRLLSYRV